jgi:hypothetical protein
MLFLKKTATDSETQLAVDFGHYPPKPLQPKKLNNQFDVLYMGSVSRIFYAARLLIHVLTDKSAIDHPDFKEARKSILKLKDRRRALITQLNSTPFYISWILLVGFLVCFSPLLVLLCLAIFVFFLIDFIRGRPFKGLGHAFDLPNWPTQVVVFPNPFKRNNYKKSEISVDGIISHEHIHLMQYIYFSERSTGKFVGENGDFLKSLLSSPERDFDFCSYYFLPNEMEARLHEVILSYYRKYKELPLNFCGFVHILVGSINPMGFVYLSKLAARLVETEKFEPSSLVARRFEVRCGLAEFEIGFAIMKLADPVKYMREVLPVMYGNLLILYGDINRAEKYFETLGPCELYTKLYGKILVPNIQQDAPRRL